MYARSVTLHLDIARWDEIAAFVDSIEDRVGAFPGLVSWVLMADRDTGEACSFSVFDDEDAFLAVRDDIDAIVSDFRRFFTAPPTEILGEVIASAG